MNSAIKLVLSRSPAVLKLSFGAGQPQKCKIHNWVRPVRYVLRKRRIEEHEKFPERAKPQRRSGFSDWNYRSELYAFGKRLGEDFQEPVLLQAFMDKSYVYSERRRREELGLDPSTVEFKDNEQLAAQGRALLETTLTLFLRNELPKVPDEGVESIVKNLLSPTTLGNISTLVGTKDIIMCSEYPPPDDVLSRAFCAVVGALEQSSGREKAEKFVVDLVASHICGKDIHDLWDIKKPWHMLLQLTKPQGKLLEPRLIREGGRNTLLSVYVVGIYDEKKKLFGTGAGETIDIAQEMAARDVLRGIFGTRNPLPPFQFQSANFPEQLIPHVRNP